MRIARRVARQRLVASRNVVQRVLGLDGDLRRDGPHGQSHVLAGGLRGLDVDVGAAEFALLAAVQQVAQREQDRCLARLPRRVHDEVALPAHQGQDISQVHPVERTHAVVVFRPHRSSGVEVAHDGKLDGRDGLGKPGRGSLPRSFNCAGFVVP